MGKNNTQKLIIKHLANAPKHAARAVLQELKTDEEKAEAMRIFRAVGIIGNNNENEKNN